MLKYPCLALDHDDTVVGSAATVNYAGICLAMAKLRPGLSFTVEEFCHWSYDPGLQAVKDQVWQLTHEEQDWLNAQWLEYVMAHMPPVFPGIGPLLQRHRAEGGKLVVISHSCRENILRDYRMQLGFEPDLIFGWELPAAQRKPMPYPLEETMRRLELAPEQILMVDDLPPGLEMARRCGVPFAAAGWGQRIPELEAQLRSSGAHYFSTVSALERFLFP